MEFEIKNIMHDKLRDYANEYDRNDEGKAGVLEKEEFSLFAEDDRVKNLIATEQNAASVFGEIKTAIVGDEITIGQTQNNEVTAQTAAEEETVEEEIAPVQLSDEQRKNVEKTFEAKVKELAKAGKDEEGLVEGLEKAFAVRYTAQEANGKHLIGDIKRDADGNPIIKPQYREYFAKLSDVYQKVQTEGYKAAKKSMDDKFSKKLAESLNRIIEEQKVTDAYNNRKAILDTKINDEKMDFKDAYKAAKKEIKQDENYTKADKKAIKRLKTRAQGMAFDKAQTILTNEETRPEGESYRAFKKEMKSYSDDKFFRKAVKDLKVHEKVLARHNKVDHFVASTIDEEGNSTFTEADMKNGLRKRALFGLVKTGGGQKLTDKLETFRDKNGNYNISALADLVIKRVGFDYKLSRNDDDKIMAEITGIVQDLADATGNKFSENEAKRIAKLVKIEIEHRNFAKGILVGIPAIVSGLLSGLNARNGKLEVTQDLLMDLTINGNEEALEDIKKQLTEAGLDFTMTSTSAASGVNVHLHLFQQVIKNDRALNALMGSLIGGAVGGAAMLAAIILDSGKNEKSCLSGTDYDINNPKYTDPERYKAYIEERYGNNPVKLAAMKALVDLRYKEYGDQWHAVFQNDLRVDGGVGSNINPEECIGVKYAKPQEPAKEVVKVTEEKNAYVGEEKVETPVDKTVEKFWDARKHQYRDLIKMYPCLLDDYSEEKAIRMLKVIQAMRNGNSDVDLISQIADDSMNRKMSKAEFIAKYKDAADFDVDTFFSVKEASIIGVDAENDGKKSTYILAPAVLTRKGEKYCEKDESLVTRTIARGGSNNGKRYGDLNDKYTVSNSKTAYFGARQNDTKVTSFKTIEARNTWERVQRSQGYKINDAKTKKGVEAELRK